MEDLTEFDLEPGETYTAADLREIFGGRRIKKGIEPCYDDYDREYIRLFSSPESDYEDDLEADPMRYVGEDTYADEHGNQTEKGGNRALIEAENDSVPIYLFEKPSADTTDRVFIGRVQVVNHEYNLRPSKNKRVFDLYLKGEDAARPTGSEPTNQDLTSLRPGTQRDLSSGAPSGEVVEEEISYTSEKDQQQESSKEHAETLQAFAERLDELGYDCKETEYSDLLATRDSEVLLAEVKSLNQENERAQIRYALGQLMEYSFRDIIQRGWGDKTERQYLVFSRPPSDAYAGFLEYLRSREIHSVWFDDGELRGLPESLDQLE